MCHIRKIKNEVHKCIPMVAFIHDPLRSTSHEMVQLLPALNDSLGPGATGVISAIIWVTKAKGRDKSEIVRVILARNYESRRPAQD
jgi:hypothetical protein